MDNSIAGIFAVVIAVSTFSGMKTIDNVVAISCFVCTFLSKVKAFHFLQTMLQLCFIFFGAKMIFQLNMVPLLSSRF